MNIANSQVIRCSSGCPGLDDIVGGGLPRGHFYLIEGEPGTGKTTLALQFMVDGARNGEKCLYVTLSESRADLLLAATSHHMPVNGFEIFELKPNEQDLSPDSQYTVFHPAEVELNDRVQTITREVNNRKPDRLVIDALSEVRMLAKDPLRYRRQILSLREYLPANCTVLLLDDRTSRYEELELHSIVHGVVSLSKVPREYGKTRRRLEVPKLRGCPYREGFHDYVIETGGLTVFPRLIAAEHVLPDENKQSASCGIPELDTLVGGGLDRGTSTLVIGPAGCGKTTIAVRWLAAAAARKEKVAAFVFEETIHTLLLRARGLGMDLRPHLDSGHMTIEHLDPAEMSPGEFVEKVRHHVDKEGAKLVLIDSLNGFLQSMPGEQFVALHLHELLTYLNNQGVVTLLILAQIGMIGNMHTPVDVSYLADNILVLRYFEVQGEVRQAISMIKKRSGAHEHTIRELRLGPDNIYVGKPLSNFQGVLTGVPVVVADVEGKKLRLNN